MVSDAPPAVLRDARAAIARHERRTLPSRYDTFTVTDCHGTRLRVVCRVREHFAVTVTDEDGVVQPEMTVLGQGRSAAVRPSTRARGWRVLPYNG